VQQGEESLHHTFDHVVLTAATHDMKPLLQEVAPAAVAPLSEVYYPPVSVIFTGFRAAQVARPLDGFGFLIPEKEKREILGTIWSSTIFPGRAPEGMVAFTSFAGGTRQPQNALLPEAELVALAVKELQATMGIQGDPVFSRVKTWEKAIPQYRMGYQRVQQLLDTLEQETPGLFFAGNFRRGISVGDSVLAAHETVQRIAGG
jgi:oxygen-dependent protoporphyrinogen oxidase